MQRHDLLGIVPQRVDDPRQLLPIRDAEDELAPSVALRRLVEPQRKRLVKQLGKPRGKLRISVMIRTSDGVNVLQYSSTP